MVCLWTSTDGVGGYRRREHRRGEWCVYRPQQMVVGGRGEVDTGGDDIGEESSVSVDLNRWWGGGGGYRR